LRVPVLVSVAGGELARLPRIGYGDQRVGWERLKVGAALRLASCLSAGSRQQVEQVARVARRPLAYAPLGVDVRRFTPRQHVAGRRERLLHVGGLIPVKDQPTLLRAFARVRTFRTAATLEIVGDGPLRVQLENLASELNVADAVRFRGAIDHGQLAAMYRQSDVFVLSSLHEAQGMVVLEAAASGVPTVGTPVGVVPELAPSAAVAVSADVLADALINVLREPERRAALVEAAAARVAAEFELERCVRRFRDLYQQLE
jgi:glycosyltransferase involved in cell wall biosynthesis